MHFWSQKKIGRLSQAGLAKGMRVLVDSQMNCLNLDPKADSGK